MAIKDGKNLDQAPTMSAADAWIAHGDAMFALLEKVAGQAPSGDIDVYEESAPGYRHDPHRELDPQLAMIASYVDAEDTVIDWGGGAGRVSLPLALRCRDVVNVESSPSMQAAFEELKADAGIVNARLIAADWLEVEELQGDVSVAVSIIGLVRDIVPFIEKLNAASRRRVIILWLAPLAKDNWYTALFPVIHGEPPVRWPDQRLLMPVLWEMGLVPEIRIVPGLLDGEFPLLQKREDVVRAVVGRIAPQCVGSPDEAGVRAIVEKHFDDYFVETPLGFRGFFGEKDPRDDRHLLITWETSK